MGCTHNCIYSHRNRHLIISLLFLLVSWSAQMRFMAEGKLVFKFIKATQMEGEEKVLERSQIGSRPPRCQRRCSSCGHCEAIQMPVIPQDRSWSKHSLKVSTRGEDSPNYKPMSWKCKCGDMIFNP